MKILQNFFDARQKRSLKPFFIVENIDFRNRRLDLTKPYLFWIENTVAGFIELEDGGYIGCLYTHPEYQRLGIATALYRYVENLAIE